MTKPSQPYAGCLISTISVDAMSRLNLSNVEVANALGYENQHNMVSNIIRGQCKLPVEKLHPLARVLRLDPHRLIEAAAKSYPDSRPYAAMLLGIKGETV